MTWDHSLGLRLPEVQPLVDFRLLMNMSIAPRTWPRGSGGKEERIPLHVMF